MPQITGEIVYLSADEEDRYAIAQANAPIDETGHFTESRVSVRRQQKFLFEAPGPHRVHGRLAEADRFGLGRADPVPRA